MSQHDEVCKLRLRLSRLHAHTAGRFVEMELSNQRASSGNLIERMNYGLLLLDKRIVAMELADEICWVVAFLI